MLKLLRSYLYKRSQQMKVYGNQNWYYFAVRDWMVGCMISSASMSKIVLL